MARLIGRMAVPQENLAYTLTPTTPGSGYMRRTDTGVNRIPLPPGVNKVTISWFGDTGITFNYRSPEGLVTTLGVNIPESISDRTPRSVVIILAVPVESSGGDLHISSTDATQWDVDRVTCGVSIVNHPGSN